MLHNYTEDKSSQLFHIRIIRQLLLVTTFAFIFVLPWRASVVVFADRTIGVLIGIIMMSIFMCYKIVDNKWRKPHTVHILSICLVAWTILSVTWSVSFRATSSGIVRPILIIGMLVIMWDLFDNLKSVFMSLKWYVMGCYVLSGMAFFEFFFGTETLTTYGSARYVGTGAAAPNIMATMLAFGAVVSWILYTYSSGNRGQTKNLIYLMYIPVGIFTIFLTGSRHGFMILLCALIYILISIIHSKNISNNLILFLAILGGGVTYVYSPGVSRIATIPEEILYGDLNNRLYLWQEALLLSMENLLFGIGYNAFRTIVGNDPHNGFLSVLVGLGIFGLIIYITIHIAVFRVAMSSAPRIRMFSVTILLMILLSHTAQSIVYNPIVWFLLNTILLLHYSGPINKNINCRLDCRKY